MKSIKELDKLYKANYSNIPKDYIERLNYLIDSLKIKESEYDKILDIKDRMINQIQYDTYNITIYEEPLGKPRPRFKYDVKFQVYSFQEDAKKRKFRNLIKEDELIKFKYDLVCTPCIVLYNAYFHPPKGFNRYDILLAETGLIRPMNKPDWDNIGKNYSDLYNESIWIDDTNVISATVNKYYSILPRVEIELSFYNSLFTIYQYKAMRERIDSNRKILYFNKGELIEGSGNA